MKDTKSSNNIPPYQTKIIKTNRINNLNWNEKTEDYQLVYQGQKHNTGLQKVGSYTKYELPMVRRLVPNSRSRQYEAYVDGKGLTRRNQSQQADGYTKQNEEGDTLQPRDWSMLEKYRQRTTSEAPKGCFWGL